MPIWINNSVFLPTFPFFDKVTFFQTNFSNRSRWVTKMVDTPLKHKFREFSAGAIRFLIRPKCSLLEPNGLSFPNGGSTWHIDTGQPQHIHSVRPIRVWSFRLTRWNPYFFPNVNPFTTLNRTLILDMWLLQEGGLWPIHNFFV